jgi:DNA replication ATP-dependent helicase Dna2
MIHEVMQTCLASEKWDDNWIQCCIEDVIAGSLPILVKIGVEIEEARRELELRAKGLHTFARRYI